MSSFNDLGLHPEILRAISETGYTQPTSIQAEAIPLLKEGADIRAAAHTGTGKTAAFLLPALHRLATVPAAKGKGPRVLILVPTRELANQVAAQAKTYGKYLPNIRSLCMIGGIPYHMQRKGMQKPYDILIATPGRLIDYLQNGQVSLSRVEMLILDEADRMLDMGFIEAVEEIAAATQEERQTLLFSATLSREIVNLSRNLMEDPKEISIPQEPSAKPNIEQRLHYADDLHHKNRLLDHILQSTDIDRAIVFTSTKQHADVLVGQLHDAGHAVAALHGDMRQQQRTRTLSQLRSGAIRILVATDVAARGIDVPTITHVINFDLPRNIEDYVHRIGRTGRAGAKGIALSFAGYRETALVRRIEQFTGQKIESNEIPGLESKGNRGGGEGARQDTNSKRSRRPFPSRRGEPSRFPERRSEGNRFNGNRSEGNRSEGNRSEGNRFEGKRRPTAPSRFRSPQAPAASRFRKEPV